MSDSVVVTAYFFPADGQRDAVIDVLSRVIPRVHAEEGCELYAIHDAPDGSIVMLEKWASVAALDAHSEGEPVDELRRLLEGKLSRPIEVTRLSPRPLGDASRGAI